MKNTKVNSKGEVPIYLRVTVNGNRFETSTNKIVEVTNKFKRIKQKRNRTANGAACGKCLIWCVLIRNEWIKGDKNIFLHRN